MGIGYIHSFLSQSGLDGHGIRTVFFMQGCIAKCAYCHNPDTWAQKTGQQYTVSQIVNIALRYKPYYGQKGGVTFSGGEPLLQSDFLLECIKALKKNNINVCIDTSGFVYSPEVLKIADSVILDIKHTNNDAHLQLCGVSLHNTLKTLEYLKQNKKDFIIRQVILPAINDTVLQVQALKHLAEETGVAARTVKIELLPYHKMGIEKYQKLGLPYKLDIATLTEEQMITLKEIINK